jgi:hypothetical protein
MRNKSKVQSPKSIIITARLTPEEYIALRDKLKFSCDTISSKIRKWVDDFLAKKMQPEN